MPYQGIQPQENREFISSVGNWAGDITWDPGPILGLYGLGKISTDPYPDIKTAQLSYPYSRVRRCRDTRFTINIAKPSGYAVCKARLRISDGILSYVRAWATIVIEWNWVGLGLSQTIPGAFDVLNTKIYVDVQSNSDTSGTTVFIDLASIDEVSYKG